jgi:uncharacterized membrane protein YedE/YeeE
MSPTTILVSLALGIAFGAVLQRAQVSAPDRIVGTLTLRDLTVLKLILLTIGVTSAGVGVLAALGLAHLKVKALTLVAVAVGGLVFGLGFALAGYCPGTCLIGASEGRRDALFTVVGGLAGALVFALVFPIVKPILVDPLSLGSPTLAEITGLGKGLAGVVFGVAVSAVALALPVRPGTTRPARPQGTPARAAARG